MKENLINLIDRYIAHPQIIFDVGSRDLEESIFFKQKYPDASVFAFEANPEQKDICSIKAANNNINFYSAAVSDQVGKHDFFAVQKDGPNPNIGASAMSFFSQDQLNFWKDIDPDSKPNTKKYEVDTITLDSFCEEKSISSIDILWMDVQGWEQQVLNGGTKMLKNIKMIYTELSFKQFYEKTSFYPDIVKFLSDYGFIQMWNQNPYDEKYKKFREHIETGLTETIFVNSSVL